MSDATIDDARGVEMKTVTSTITTGAAVCRIIPEESSQEFLRVFNDVDLIVSKDQGNLESVFCTINKPTAVYLFRVKRDPIAKRFGCNVGSTAIAIEKARSIQHRSDGI